MSDFRGNSLAVWYLENPLNARIVGRVKLEASNRRCLLELDDEPSNRLMSIRWM
jgi:serine/threonine-protein kinase HipA